MFVPIKIPRYRRALSYVTEQVLETTSSDYNDFLQVLLVSGRLQLVAEEAIYSFGDYYLNFRKLFERFDFEALPEDSNCLILGLGLGSIPEMLEDLLALSYSYVAVEIDPVIIELASDYSLPDRRSPIEVVEADAAAFLRADVRRYDLICVDVFQDATVPEHLVVPDFLDLLKARLAPGGAIVYNRLADTAEHKKEALAYYEGPFLKAFPGAGFYNSGGNLLLLNERRFLE